MVYASDMVYACLAVKPGACYLNLSVSLLVIRWGFSVSLFPLIFLVLVAGLFGFVNKKYFCCMS